jgi:hypothetical protein
MLDVESYRMGPSTFETYLNMKPETNTKLSLERDM